MEENRGSWGSNLGFILAAIGSAVGLGNLWGFPYKMGANGGLPFLLIYLGMVVLCGIMIIAIEMCIGRNTGKSPILAMAALGKQYKVIGIFGVCSAFIIMGFYSVLIGYSLRYFVGFVAQLVGMDGFAGTASGAEFFMNFTYDVPSVILFTVLAFVITDFIVGSGIEGGLERFNKIGMPALFLILIAIILYNFTLPGYAEGYKFIFTTKGMEIAGTEFNFIHAMRAAGGQMLFSLSLGMGAMITYGSYLDKSSSIAKNSWIVPLFDTLAAVLAGMAIFPAVFATGNSVNAGPGLLFITMQDVFSTMGGVGNIVGMLFYLLVIFAGISSSISLMEVVSASVIDHYASKGKKVSRKKTVLLVSLGMFFLSLFICLDKLGCDGENGVFWNLYSFLGAGSQDLLDLYDLITEGFLMPFGALCMCLIVGYKKGFDWMKEEVLANGKPWRCEKFFRFCIKTISPVLMAFVLVSLFLSYFGL